jgi:hypothetical protein
MPSKKHYNRKFISKKKIYNGGTKCDEYPDIWKHNDNCVSECPENTCNSYDNDQFICRSLDKKSDKCKLTKIINNTLSGDLSDGYIFENTYDTLPSIYYGKLNRDLDGRVIRVGLGLNIDKNTNEIYYGNFINNKRDGEGLLLWKPNGALLSFFYEGTWKNGMKDGTNNLEYVYNSSTGRGETYQGDFKNGLRHGHGVKTSDNQDRYEGDFRDNFENGFGSFYEYESRDTYVGHWLNGKKHGKGIETEFKTRRIYDGNFYNGYRHGSALYTDEDSGIIYNNQWNMGYMNK